MNWGWKIVVLYSAFVVMTLSMVVYFMGQKVDLVADDYYKQEIEYQGQIDKISNTKSLIEQLGYEFSSEHRTIKLTFPELHTEDGIKGKIHFYRPSDADVDKKIDVRVNQSGEQVVSIASLDRGLWKIRIAWSSGGMEYFDEKIVTL